MPAKKKPVPAMKKAARQPRKRKPISISPMHSSAEESGGDGEPVEEVQQVHSGLYSRREQLSRIWKSTHLESYN